MIIDLLNKCLADPSTTWDQYLALLDLAEEDNLGPALITSLTQSLTATFATLHGRLQNVEYVMSIRGGHISYGPRHPSSLDFLYDMKLHLYYLSRGRLTVWRRDSSGFRNFLSGWSSNLLSWILDLEYGTPSVLAMDQHQNLKDIWQATLKDLRSLLISFYGVTESFWTKPKLLKLNHDKTL